jgi:hypothetical protein
MTLPPAHRPVARADVDLQPASAVDRRTGTSRWRAQHGRPPVALRPPLPRAAVQQVGPTAVPTTTRNVAAQIDDRPAWDPTIR